MDERLRVFLTNSLEEAHEYAGLPLFAQWLAHEAAAASEVKRDVPIMVVLGNPPYSGHSANKSAWIESLMETYEQSPELKKPTQAKWLSDDYVKFIRFAQWRIEQTGFGAVGFISNHRSSVKPWPPGLGFYQRVSRFRSIAEPRTTPAQVFYGVDDVSGFGTFTGRIYDPDRSGMALNQLRCTDSLSIAGFILVWPQDDIDVYPMSRRFPV